MDMDDDRRARASAPTRTRSRAGSPGPHRHAPALRAIALSAAALCATAPPGAHAHVTGAASRADAPTILPGGVRPEGKDGAGAQAQPAELEVSLAPGSGPGLVRFSLANASTHPIRVLRDATPFEDVLGEDLFRVVPAGKGAILDDVVPYVGPTFRRLPPDASRFLSLGPGASVSVELDLASNYLIPATGDYRLVFTGTFHVLQGGLAPRRAGAPLATEAVRPDTSALRIGMPASTAPALTARARQPAFDGCSASERASIETATVDGEAIALESVQSLAQTPEGARATSPRYTTWFGAHSTANYARVEEVFGRAASVLTDEPISYRCGSSLCSERALAFVQPLLRDDVNICPLFFDPRVGDTGRAGTVVHELTHLIGIGNTDDLSYGATATANVARASGADAIRNAEAYTLFATNDSPPLPMIDDGSGTGDVADVPDEVEDPPADDRFVALPAGGSARGELPEDEIDLYRVVDVSALALTSLDGDADLYVFDDASLSRDSLECTANAFSGDSTVDSCEIIGDGERFVVVHAFTAASYRLDSTAIASTTSTLAEGAVALAMGESTNGELAEGEVSVFTAVMPGTVALTTLEGDADLYVFRDSTLSEEALVCRSTLTTPEDDCALPGTGRIHAVVYGFGASNRYELGIEPLSDDAQTTPGPGRGGASGTGTGDADASGTDTSGPDAGGVRDEDPAGTTVLAAGTGGGGGGGAPAWPALAILALACAHRRRRRARTAS